MTKSFVQLLGGGNDALVEHTRDCRHLDSLPDGWRYIEGAQTAPRGWRWANNGKSRFGGEYENALIMED